MKRHRAAQARGNGLEAADLFGASESIRSRVIAILFCKAVVASTYYYTSVVICTCPITTQRH